MKSAFRVLLLLVAIFSSLAGLSEATTAQAATITVQNTADDGPGSLRQGVRDAAAGDTIDFDSDVRGSIVLTSGVIEIHKPLTIAGPGADELGIDGDDNSSIFYNFANGVTIFGLMIYNARGVEGAGAVYNTGQLTLREVSVADSIAYPAPRQEPPPPPAVVASHGSNTNRTVISDTNSFGGGVFNATGATLNILSSAIYRNGAELGAGIANGGTLNISNSTIAQNSAHSLYSDAAGGGIYNYGGKMRLTGVTVAGNFANEAAFGGGIANLGRASLANSIVSSNHSYSGTDLFGNFTSLDYNLIGHDDNDFVLGGTATHDIVGRDAKLDRFGFYGGPTPTHALRVGSPALDAGKAFGLVTDQRTERRPYNRTDIANAPGGDGSDIGAFEDHGPVDVPQDSSTLVVNTSRDTNDGTCSTRDCSLREAINAANARAGTKTITFNLTYRDINGLPVGFIELRSGLPPVLNGPPAESDVLLPAIGDNITIDGSTQPGFSGEPLIIIVAGGRGLSLSGNGSKVKSVSLRGFDEACLITGENNRVEGCEFFNTGAAIMILDGINNVIGGVTPPLPGSTLSPSTNFITRNRIGVRITGNSRGNALMNNAIGTTPDRQLGVGNWEAGVVVEEGATGNLIGVPTGVPGFGGNLISGNLGPGIWIRKGANGNSVQNNFIGTNFVPQIARATKAIPNKVAGILIENSSDNRIGGDAVSSQAFSTNTIAGNEGSGIYIETHGENDVFPLATGNIVRGNAIGLDLIKAPDGKITGVTAIPNTEWGIILSDSPANVIGDNRNANAVVPNYIGCNGASGIYLVGAKSTSNIIQANYIGLYDGGSTTIAMGNKYDGITLSEAAFNLIGGSSSRAGNIISKNGAQGIGIYNPAAKGNKILHNRIGTDSSGLGDYGNGGNGIRVSSAPFTIIGGAPDTGNVIAYNREGGISLLLSSAIGTAIRANRIFQNRQQGIDLGADGLTGNDTRDADTGPNRRQNYPVLTSVVGNTRSQISGTINSLPNQAYAIDFFSAATGRSVQAPDANKYLGTLRVRTNAQGTATFTHVVGERLGSQFITSTATQVSTGDTSEFSPSKRALVDQTAPDISSVNVQSLLGIGGVTVTVTARDAQGINNVRLRFKRRTTRGGAIANTFETKTAFVRTLPNGALLYELKTKGLAPGFYSVEAIVEDGLGNTSISSAREFFVLINNLGNLFN